MSKRNATLLGALALAVVLTGCGDSDGESESAATVTTVTTGTASAEPDSGEPFTGDAGSAWCEMARDLDEGFDESEQLTSFDPATLEDLYTRLSGDLSRAEEVAPDEIRADVTNVVGGVERIVDLLEGADWDLTQISASDAAALDDPSLIGAAERIERYGIEVCGLEPDAAEETPSGSSAQAEQAVIDALVGLGLDEEQARCLAQTIVASGGSTDDLLSDPQALADQCGISLQDLAGLLGGG
jgi:hypothetical protein